MIKITNVGFKVINVRLTDCFWLKKNRELVFAYEFF